MGMYAYPFGTNARREVEIKLSGYVAEWFREAATRCQCNWIVDGTLLATREVVEQAILVSLETLKKGITTGWVYGEHQTLLKISTATRNMAILIEWLANPDNQELFFG